MLSAETDYVKRRKIAQTRAVPKNLTVKEERMVLQRRARQKVYRAKVRKKRKQEEDKKNMVHLNAGNGICDRNRGNFGAYLYSRCGLFRV